MLSADPAQAFHRSHVSYEMAEQRPSSFLFSLRGLLEREQEAEQARRIRQAELDRARTRERERFAREMVEKKRLAELEVLRLELERKREEAARLEALRLATLERARVESEARAQLEILEKQQEHERKLCAIREAARAKGQRQLAIVGFVLAGVTTLGALGTYFGKLRPEAQRLSIAYDDLVAAERTRAEETAKLLERADKRNDALTRELHVARNRIDALEKRPPPPKTK
jgi:colicin import membrane protein